MPPATQFEGDFFGDHSGLSAATWPTRMMDTATRTCSCATTPPATCPAAEALHRAGDHLIANDENIYTKSLRIPLP
jgi:hypothetical protein